MKLWPLWACIAMRSFLLRAMPPTAKTRAKPGRIELELVAYGTVEVLEGEEDNDIMTYGTFRERCLQYETL